ncbi:hypothetical protein [Pelobium manganitolerans]|uniref:hypothetical protein n=1 Tax=Pelobium manganitolerans TaxID=1842495 RepID=UPI0016022307|nr:hypothetical protein [Pelobium manganitolerans]
MKYRLKEDVYSRFHKNKLYGKKGTLVSVLSQSGNVLIVQGTGCKFPVLKNQLIGYDK